MAEERFPPIRTALAAAGRDARDRDAFLLTREAAELVHDLRPEEGMGEGIDRLAALVHNAFLFWDGAPSSRAWIGPPSSSFWPPIPPHLLCRRRPPPTFNYLRG